MWFFWLRKYRHLHWLNMPLINVAVNDGSIFWKEEYLCVTHSVCVIRVEREVGVTGSLQKQDCSYRDYLMHVLLAKFLFNCPELFQSTSRAWFTVLRCYSERFRDFVRNSQNSWYNINLINSYILGFMPRQLQRKIPWRPVSPRTNWNPLRRRSERPVRRGQAKQRRSLRFYRWKSFKLWRTGHPTQRLLFASLRAREKRWRSVYCWWGKDLIKYLIIHA